MYFTTVITVLSAVSFGAAAPANRRSVDKRTSCQPGSGFYQDCSNGFKGCCTADACSLGYCPGAAPVDKPATGTCTREQGAWYVCSTGFVGCCTTDPCAIGYCLPPAVKEQTTTPPCSSSSSTTVTTTYPTTTPTLPPMLSTTHNCSTHSMTSTSSSTTPYSTSSSSSTSTSTTTYSSCTTHTSSSTTSTTHSCTTHSSSTSTTTPATTCGCHHDQTTIPAMPAVTPTPTHPSAQQPSCAAGTGYYQVCSNGFKGCCAQDACTLGYCPGTPADSCSKPVDKPADKPAGGNNNGNGNGNGNGKDNYPGYCAAGTGYYQVCANGFKGCCKEDACSLGYCPSAPRS